MRRLLFVFSLLLFVLQASIGQYTVKIRFAKLLWDSYSPYSEDYNQNEWSVNLHADVFDSNNNYVSPSSSIYYTWFKKDTSGGSFRIWYEGTGPVHSHTDPDGLKTKSQTSPGTCSTCSYQAYEVKVWAEIDGNTYISSVVRVPDDFIGSMTGQKEIVTDQLLENQSSTGNLALNKDATLYNYPASFTHYAFSGVSQTFRARQDVVSNQKYLRWNINAQDVQNVVNHQSFGFTQNSTLKGQLKTANDATIQTYVADGGYVSSSVEFKDPWLIDDNSDNLGPRNRGTSAVFVSKSTPFYPLSDGNTNGVFLDQSVASGNYYSVRTAQNIYATGLMWSFGSWSYSNASLSSTTNLETAVVFTASNATVTANYNTVVKPLLLDAVWITADEGDGKIRLNWDENPSSNVQYKIYRKINGGSPSLLATVNHGTATWKDNAYYYTDEHTSYNLSYDVRCYHQPTATYSDERWYSAFGSLYPPQAWGSGPLASKKPSKITFEGYPNPFNPSTKLMYSLKADSRVQLYIYDVLGRSVAELVDGFQHAGYYSYMWNATNLVTGVYFARLVVQAESEKPAVLTSKLLLAK